MKHSLAVTLLIIAGFLLAQFAGLAIVYKYIDPVKSREAGKTVFKDLPIGERPPVDEGTSYIPVIIAILLGTGILLLLVHFHLTWVWKLWFFIAVFLALTMAFGAFVPKELALLLGLGLGAWKVFRPNFWVQNLTELFVYGGLAAIFAPIFTLWSVGILLVLIAGYDAYAVWQSKHMVTLAKSQMKEKVFAGLLIPYKIPRSVSTRVKAVPQKVRTAVLGGGDIGFPLIFAGVVMKEIGIWQSLLIPFFALGGLIFLLWYGKEKKFYPAMPFIGAGCLLGLGVVLLVEYLV